MAKQLEFTWKGFGYTAEHTGNGTWKVTQEFTDGAANGEPRATFTLKAGSKAGMGHVKAGLKEAMRQKAKVLADSTAFGQKIVSIPGKGTGIIAAFNPRVRYAIACQYLGC